MDKDIRTLRTIARNSFKANKTRNIFVIIALVLTGILFSGLFTLCINMKTISEEQTMRIVGTTAHASYSRLSREEYSRISKNENIKDASYSIYLAKVDNKELSKRDTELRYIEKKDAEWSYQNPKEGRLPVKENEIATDTIVLKMLNIEPKIGSKITLKYEINSKEYVKEYVLSGYWEGDEVKTASQCFVSKVMADQLLAGFDEVRAKNSLETSDQIGLLTANVFFDSTINLKEKAEQAAIQSGCDLEKIKIGVNWGYLNAGINSSNITTICFILLLLLLLMITGYFIIYNIFSISVKREIHFYGLLKALGITSTQIRKILWNQIFKLSVIGIPLGLLVGYLIGISLTPILLDSQGGEHLEAAKYLSINPWIFIGATVFSFLTVIFSVRKPNKIASNVSPIEALRFEDEIVNLKPGGKRGKNSFSIAKMARANIKRSGKRMVLVSLSLALSIVVLNSVYTIISGFSIDKYLSKRVETDFAVGNSKLFTQKQDFSDNTSGVKQELIDLVCSQPGIKNSGACYFTYGSQILGGDFQTKYDEYFSSSYIQQTNESYHRVLEQSIEDIKANGYSLSVNLYGLDEFPMSYLKIVDGTLDYKKMEDGNYIVLNQDNINSGNSLYQIGDRVSFVVDYEGTPHEEEFEVIAIVEDLPTGLSTQQTSLSCTTTTAYISSKQFKEKITNPLCYEYVMDVNDAEQENMEQVLKKYTEFADTEMGYSSKMKLMDEFYTMIKSYEVIGISLVLIIAVIGIVNLINVLLTSLIERRNEIAILQALGMTEKQLKYLLTMEGECYILNASFISIVVSVFCSFLIKKIIEDIFWFFDFKFTILPVIFLIVIYIVITAVLPVVIYSYINKGSIVERLKISN